MQDHVHGYKVKAVCSSHALGYLLFSFNPQTLRERPSVMYPSLYVNQVMNDVGKLRPTLLRVVFRDTAKDQKSCPRLNVLYVAYLLPEFSC